MGGVCRSVLASFFLFAITASVPAQEPAEKAWVFCDPERHCQPPGDGERCICGDDTMEVVFDGASDSVLEYETFVEGREFEITVVFDTHSDTVQAWSFGLQHDGARLSLLAATVEGTDAAGALEGGFVAVQTTGLASCPEPPPALC